MWRFATAPLPLTNRCKRKIFKLFQKISMTWPKKNLVFGWPGSWMKFATLRAIIIPLIRCISYCVECSDNSITAPMEPTEPYIFLINQTVISTYFGTILEHFLHRQNFFIARTFKASLSKSDHSYAKSSPSPTIRDVSSISSENTFPWYRIMDPCVFTSIP